MKGDNRRQWETTGDKTTSEPKKPTTPTNTKAARSKVALRTPTANCLGNYSNEPQANEIIVSILVDVIVATCNKNSLATSQSLNRTQSAPRKSCFASTEVCPKGSFLFGTLKITLHFMTFCSATCHISARHFRVFPKNRLPCPAVASRRPPPRSRRPRASGDVVAQSSGAARERRSGPPLKPPGEVPRGK